MALGRNRDQHRREKWRPRAGPAAWAGNPQDAAGGGCATRRLRRFCVPSTLRRAGCLRLASAKPRGVCPPGKQSQLVGRLLYKQSQWPQGNRRSRQTNPIGGSPLYKQDACDKSQNSGVRAAFRGQYRRLFRAVATFVGRVKQSQFRPDGSTRSRLSWTPASAGATTGAGTGGTNEANWRAKGPGGRTNKANRSGAGCTNKAKPRRAGRGKSR